MKKSELSKKPSANSKDESKPSTVKLSSSKTLQELGELLEENWEDEDSRISIAEINIHHSPKPNSMSPSSINPKNWQKKTKVTGIVSAIVIGVVAGLKAAWEMGLFDWMKQ